MTENVSVLTGILVDFSCSMKSSPGIYGENADWVRLIFQVMDSLIKSDVSVSNQVFAIGFGPRHKKGIFDILHTLENLQTWKEGIDLDLFTEIHNKMIDRILDILERGGATSVRKWATRDVVKRVVSLDLARVILHQLENDHKFVKTVVDNCLPRACKGMEHTTVGYVNSWIPLVGNSINFVAQSVATTFKPATEYDVKEVVRKALAMKKTKSKIKMENVVFSSIYSAREASEILHGCGDVESLDRLRELMKAVEPLVYGEGEKPFYTSLKLALELFRSPNYHNHKKLLFVLSDGMLPIADSSHKDELFTQLKSSGITTVSCFVAMEPRSINHANYSQEDAVKMLFDLSSNITTHLLPNTFFLNREGQIFINNKLFLKVNHPSIINDACNLAHKVFHFQDALADESATGSLDMFINQNKCYDSASAAVLLLSLKRIQGEKGNYPSFSILRQQLVKGFDEHGSNTLKVVQTVCHQYRLNCKEVTPQEAMAAVRAKRPTVATFQLTELEWKVFSEFYRINPTGILTRKEIDISKRHENAETVGHAVVLTSYNSEFLGLMNSWGIEWGVLGFFRVQNAEVLGLEFIDIF